MRIVVASLVIVMEVTQIGTLSAQLPAPAQPQGFVASPERVRVEDDRSARVDAEVTDLASFVKWAQAARRERVAALYKRREAIRAERGSTRLKRERIEATNAEIVRINSPTEPYLLPVTANKAITLGEASAKRQLRVLEVVDGQTARVRFTDTSVGGRDLEFFLVGTDTAGWVDGGKPPLDGVLIADGSRTYATTDGVNRTIAVMKHYALPKDELTRRDEMRTWTDEAGNEDKGVLVLYEAGRVMIMDMDGQVTNLKFTELSEADREYVGKFAPTPVVRRRETRP